MRTDDRSANPPGTLPPPRRGGPTDPSHDEELRRGIIRTRIRRPTAWFLTLFFLGLIYAVPLSQMILDHINEEESVILDLFAGMPDKDSLRQLEEDLENVSYVKTYVQPRLQLLLTGFGRAGNKRAVVGHDGWLYYEPGVAFLGGPAFLSDDVLDSRRRTARTEEGEELHADPRPAIFAFREALARRDITLVLFPVADKAMLVPRPLHGRVPENASVDVPRNLDWNRFLREMTVAGIPVFDPSPARLEPGEPPRFLVQDTHWTPEWMAKVATELAAFVEKTVPLPPATTTPGFTVKAETVSRIGDIVDMLRLPDDQTLFQPNTVTVQQVLTGADADTGVLFEPDEKADVLLLGDSFTNIFTLAPMGWGEGAGLGPHLARALGRPIDVIAQNDAGAFATRRLLAQELAAGADRLAGKRVVIWQFAARELGVGDWKPVAWPEAPGGE